MKTIVTALLVVAIFSALGYYLLAPLFSYVNVTSPVEEGLNKVNRESRDRLINPPSIEWDVPREGKG